MLWSHCGRVRAPQTLPCLQPSIPAQLFGEGSLKPLAEKTLVSSPRAPRVGCWMVGPCLPLSLRTPTHAQPEQSPHSSPRFPTRGVRADCNRSVLQPLQRAE